MSVNLIHQTVLCTSNQACLLFVSGKQLTHSLFPPHSYVVRPCLKAMCRRIFFSSLCQPIDDLYTTWRVFNESTITCNWQKLSGTTHTQPEQLCCCLPPYTLTHTFTSSQIKQMVHHLTLTSSSSNRNFGFHMRERKREMLEPSFVLLLTLHILVLNIGEPLHWRNSSV